MAKFFPKITVELNIPAAVCFPISPLDSEQLSVLGLILHLETHLRDVTNKGNWVTVEREKNIKQLPLQFWPSMNDVI